MKILSAKQVQDLDQFTITQQGILSIDLMERASRVFSDWLQQLYPNSEQPIVFFCGNGNNGGDGLAAARMLHEAAYPVQVILCDIGQERSDRRINRERLEANTFIPISTLKVGDTFPQFSIQAICVDAIFGSGLNRPVEGYWASLIKYLNQLPIPRIAIDIPSGLFADQHSTGVCIHAEYTLSFELAKLAFLMPENQDRVGRWEVLSIGLEQNWIRKAPSLYKVLTADFIKSLLYTRKRFDHKGTFGHSLIIAGSYGKIGACVLSAKAALRAGAGLITIHSPGCGYDILQSSIPEAMLKVDQDEFVFSQIGSIESYRSIGVGPGLGQDKKTVDALSRLIDKVNQSIILDADALNIIGSHPNLFNTLPANSILSPHPKEFERLFGPTANDFARLDRAKERAQSLGVIIILKMGYTAIVLPDGKVFFNIIGNPGMGTAGSGDVLTGIISGLLAQSYNPADASMLGVYLHALAGDLAATEESYESLIASDIISHLGNAYQKLRAHV